jgi:ATPase subunit of ABC transporter with duplicated ATPase domains
MGDGDRRRDSLNGSFPLLVVADLVAGYADRVVVGPVSFTVDQGDILGLAGPNGAGKTTILNAIIGTAKVFAGRIVREPETRVSVQRQYPVRLREMPLNGRELLRLTGAFDRPLPAALEPLMDIRIDRISGGQFQLLQVWACLGSAADLVLLDEPTNNMDPHAIATLVELLIAARDRRAVLVISHDQSLLERVCTSLLKVGP